jgi:hypothetical protein
LRPRRAGGGFGLGEDRMAPRRWPGIVPATIVVVAMLVVWMVWVGARVALPDSVGALGAATGSAAATAPEEECFEGDSRL